MRCRTLSTDLHSQPRRAARRERAGASTLLGATAVACLLLAGCRQDMHDAPRFDPLEKTNLYADGRSARYPVAGTVARGHLNEDAVFFTGKDAGGQLVATLPMKVDAPLLKRGQERYNIFCSPCHDQLGTGNGMIVRRGYKQPQTYHSERLRTQPVGYFFDVMTNGFGQMPSYAAQVPAKDRWAIAAYIRVLQLSQNAHLAELSPADRQALANAGQAVPAGDQEHHGDASAHGGRGE